MTAPFLLSPPGTSSEHTISARLLRAPASSYDISFAPAQGSGALVYVGVQSVSAYIGATLELHESEDSRRIAAGYEKLAQQSADEKDFEDARRARRDRNRALRLV
jgi:hypothetical protein